jgi:hypothetical protein
MKGGRLSTAFFIARLKRRLLFQRDVQMSGLGKNGRCRVFLLYTITGMLMIL